MTSKHSPDEGTATSMPGAMIGSGLPRLAMVLALALLLPAVAVPGAHGEPAAANRSAAASEIVRFFSGRTEGLGQLKVMMHSTVAVRVHGSGRIESDGTLVLEQVINEGDKPPRTRTWRIREVSPGRYAGTLSDAVGPVTGEQAGGRLHLAFTGTDGNGYQQWLTFAGDGRSAHNVLQVRKFGLVVANLDETIRKLD